MGTYYFSRGMADAALREWAEARDTGSRIPVLSASTGLALLHVKDDPQKALAAFREGLQDDPSNVANYMGMDQALSLMARPPSERIEALQRYPKLEAAPPGLVFELILNHAEAGEFEPATYLFHNRFFPREEGGTNVRQVWIEVQLQRALSMARAEHCDQAAEVIQHLEAEVPGLSFTRDGLVSIIQSARTSYLLATAYSQCGKPEEASSAWKRAAAASAPDQIHWAWLAAQKLPGFNAAQWQSRLQAGFEQAAYRSQTSGYPGWWMYSAGALAKDLGRNEEAEFRFKKALLLPDRMLSYHLTRLMRSGTTP
jgi:tetratricopeptide (TPR) repeat protein